MLIKPWTEVLQPRHVFEDEDDNASTNLIPEVSVDLNQSDSSNIDQIIICPATIKIILEKVANKETVGTVNVKYPQIGQVVNEHMENNDEYDEDEQLYTAIMEKSLKGRFTDLLLPIWKYEKSLMIVVPHITNLIATNILGEALVDYFYDKAKSWITFSPCLLNNNETLNKLSLKNQESKLDYIPNVKPPHFITGISASINSLLSTKQEAELISLILNAEGQPGYERLDNDSLIDASHVFSKIFLKENTNKYLEDVSLSVRSTSYSNSGMYI